jgi:UDP-glucose 4-epimerase
MSTVLVVGGAGYIGSHVVRDLTERGYTVVVYDNLSEGHREAVGDGNFIQADINDTERLYETFQKYAIDAVMHFSAYAYVGESVVSPEKYYLNNVSATINLLSSMLRHEVKTFIFSSSCATFGNPVYLPIDENHPQNPINPYGRTKLIVEKMLADYAHAYGLRFIALRYFNAAGAHPDGSIGESHRIETHLIPLVLKTITGEKDCVRVFGNDYGTADGTCVRDYIHVCDLAKAHRLALERMLSGNKSCCVNLGTGRGTSVKGIIAACEEVTGRKVPVVYASCRPGDSPELVASSRYAGELLEWEPDYTDIRDIVRTAWEWEQNRRF